MPTNIATFQLTLRQLNRLYLPEHSGSMLRGAFGHALRELACITGIPNCEGCPLVSECRYPAIFENAILPTLTANHSTTQPYMLRLPTACPRHIETNQTWSFGITLIGQAIEDYVLILRAWQQAFQVGLIQNKRVSHSQIIKITNQTQTIFLNETSNFKPINDPAIPAHHIKRVVMLAPIKTIKQIDLHFLTPFRLQHQGKIAYHSHQFEPKALLINLYNRILHCQQHDPEKSWQTGYENFEQFLRDIESLTVIPTLTSIKVTRHSSRQQRKIDLFGLQGDIRIEGNSELLNRLLPLFWLGQYLHIGKNATLGMGQYQLRIRH